MQTKALKGTIRERGEQRKVRRMFKMLREVWLNIGIEKVDMYESIGNVYEQKDDNKK